MPLLKGSVVGRLAVLARPNGQVIGNTIGRADRLDVLLSDRKANGEAFEGERVVRLPRRFSRPREWENLDAMLRRLQAWSWGDPWWPLSSKEPVYRLPIEE